MTTHPELNSTPPPTQDRSLVFFDRLPGVKILKNLHIGVRLLIGFGILIILTLLSAAFSYLGSVPATDTLQRTNNVSYPTALTAGRAQTNLHKMQSDVRSYLVLGDPKYRLSYQTSEQAFEADLAKLQELSDLFNATSQERLRQLQAALIEWQALPEQLFELRDDQLEREPAYKLLATDGSELAGNVLIDTNTMIEIQSKHQPSAENTALLEDFAKFQGTFAAMFSALRGYVTTRNSIYRQEYEANIALNEFNWARLLEKKNLLDTNQQATLEKMQANREKFLQLPPQLFATLEGEHWREDLYLFGAQAVPLADKMEGLLNGITDDQTKLLGQDLNEGQTSLIRANTQTLTIGLVVLILGIFLTLIFRESVAGPVRRLTTVAEQIRAGYLEAQAQVESRDEIGQLADTFNSMTARLREILQQVRQEKKRADDLLDVVIPIGVDLASEKNFNLLLEKMLLEAKAFCRADAGILYLRTEDKRLEFVIVRNDTLNISMGGFTGKEITHSRLIPPLALYDAAGQPNYTAIATYVALNGLSLNIPDINQPEWQQFTGLDIFGDDTEYRCLSHLAVPLKNSEDEVIGVMHLINAQNPAANQVIPFDPNLQRMMESFSSLAVAALEAYIREQKLKQEIQDLRIEIDHVKRQQEVKEIVDGDAFKTLKDKAQEIRRKRQQK